MYYWVMDEPWGFVSTQEAMVFLVFCDSYTSIALSDFPCVSVITHSKLFISAKWKKHLEMISKLSLRIWMHRRDVHVSISYSFRIISWNLIIVTFSYQENTFNGITNGHWKAKENLDYLWVYQVIINMKVKDIECISFLYILLYPRSDML